VGKNCRQKGSNYLIKMGKILLLLSKKLHCAGCLSLKNKLSRSFQSTNGTHFPQKVGTAFAIRYCEGSSSDVSSPPETTMINIKHLAVLTALAFSSAAVAHATPINGFLSASSGTDVFSSSFINFTPNTATVGGTIGGTFATYLTDGNPITFLSGNLPYFQGAHTTPGGIPIQFFTTAENGETFAFFLTNYDANYGTGIPGCVAGDTCLSITGNGFFTGTGAVAYSQSPATFQFTSQYVPGQTVGSTVTTFSASASATGSQVPEPASLALFGTGLLGVVGIARRKFLA
jgi:hypothetical protein